MEHLSERGHQVLALARNQAQNHFQPHVLPEHLLMGVLKLRGGLGIDLLTKLAQNVSQLTAELAPILKHRQGATTYHPEGVPLSAQVREVERHAQAIAHRMSHRSVGSEHLLIALATVPQTAAYSFLNQRGLTAEKLRDTLVELHGGEPVLTLACASMPVAFGAPPIFTVLADGEVNKMASQARGPSLAKVLMLEPQHLLPERISKTTAQITELSRMGQLIVALHGGAGSSEPSPVLAKLLSLGVFLHASRKQKLVLVGLERSGTAAFALSDEGLAEGITLFANLTEAIKSIPRK